MHYGHDDGGDDDVVDGDDGGVVGEDDDDYAGDDGNRISFNLFSITPSLGVNGYSGNNDMEINFSIIRCQSVEKHGGYCKDGVDDNNQN